MKGLNGKNHSLTLWKVPPIPPLQFCWLGNTCIYFVILSLEKRKWLLIGRKRSRILRKGAKELPVVGHAGVQEPKIATGLFSRSCTHAALHVTQPRTQDQVVYTTYLAPPCEFSSVVVYFSVTCRFDAYTEDPISLGLGKRRLVS